MRAAGRRGRRRVHRRGARTLGAAGRGDAGRRRHLDAGALARGRGAARRGGGVRHAGAARDRGRRRRACTSARPTTCTRSSPRSRWRTASTSSARSRSRSAPRRPAELIEAARAADRIATVPFVYRFHPVVREARARLRAGALGPVRLIHGGYLQDWLASADDDNWRIDADLGGPSRAFADIGSHWCDLVEFLTGDRITALCAQTATVFPERASHAHAQAFAATGSGNGKRRAVTTEDAVSALFRTESGAQGTLIVSQVSPGRKNDLHVEIACEHASVRFEQERPETLWVGRRDHGETLWRDPGTLGPEAAPYAIAPAGHPQGYLDCFDLFVADTYAAIAGGDAPDGLPTFADGARSARLIDAVLESARRAAWVEV